MITLLFAILAHLPPAYVVAAPVSCRAEVSYFDQADDGDRAEGPMTACAAAYIADQD